MNDPRIFGTPEFELPGSPLAVPDAHVPYTAPAKVSSAAAVGAAGLPQATAIAAARDVLPATVGESAAAAWSQTLPMSIWDYANSPSVAPEEGYNKAAQMADLELTLDDNERAMLDRAESSTDFDYKLSRIEAHRKAGIQMGSHPFISMAVSIADPVQLGIDAMSGGFGLVGRAARLGRGAQRAMAATGATALTYGAERIRQEEQPISDTEVVLTSLGNGAIAGMFYSPALKALKKVDEDFPAPELAGAVDITRTQHAVAKQPYGWNPDKGVGPRHAFSAPDVTAPKTALDVALETQAIFKGTEFEDIAEAILRAPELSSIKASTSKEIQAMSPRSFGFVSVSGEGGIVSKILGKPGAHKIISLQEGGGADVALHELSHAVLQTRFEMPAFKKQMDELVDIQRNIMHSFRDTFEIPNGGTKFLKGQMEDMGEFIAYSLSSPTFRKWAKENSITSAGLQPKKMPHAWVNPGQKPVHTVWDSIMDLFSRVLGMGRPRLEAFTAANDNWAATVMQNEWPVYQSLDSRLNELVKEITTGAGAGPRPLFTDGITTVEFAMQHSEKELRQKLIEDDAKTQKLRKAEWSLYGSLSKFSPESKAWADNVVDDPLNQSGDSVVSQARAARADLSRLQYEYEDLLLKAMAKRKGGLFNRIFHVGEATQVQAQLERELKMEMLARERITRLGLKTTSTSTPEIRALADSMDKAYAAGLAEMKAAGVDGADDILEQSGYFTRRWDSTNLQSVERKLTDAGATVKEAHAQLTGMLAQGMRRANGWEDELARDIAGAILDRTRRKGNFEDSAFRSHAGNEAAAELRDILTKSGLEGTRLQRAMDVVTGVIDEAGKVSILKHRIDIDMKAGIRLPDGSLFTTADLVDSNLTRQLEVYLDTVAGRVGLAKKGLGSISEQAAARKKALASVDSIPKREELAKLMDNTMDNIMGRPTGEDMNGFMRGMASVNRMVALSGSGMWQATEFAPMMARYGGLKTIGHMLKEMPQFRELYGALRKDKGIASDLKNILAGNGSQDTRLRPFIQRMEDNFEIDPGNTVQLALQQAQQLVPYVNAQRFVQNWQARVAGNLIVDTLQKAAKGDVRAMKVMEQYGLESGILQKVSEQIKAAGTDTRKWSDGVWNQLRGPVTKAMDDAVLRARTGEIPAFAQFTATGKFIFTFRSFVLAAHNKVLLGTANRDGLAGLGKLMLMQLPLTYLATVANNTLAGKNKVGQSDEDYQKEMLMKAFSQVGSFGLFSEVFGIALGTKQEFGAPGLIAIDRALKIGASIGSNVRADEADWGKTAEAGWNALPILSITPVIKAIGTTFPKED